MSQHLRQAWREVVAAKEAAGNVLYHLTDKVDFRLDPKKRPDNNTTISMGPMPPGIFVGQSVEAWVNGYGYWRPWVVEIEVPPDVRSAEGVSGGYSGEVFIPARYYDRLRVIRVVPLDAHCREEFGDWGWTEAFFETTFDTEQPFERKGYSDWSGYRYPGDARQTDPAWQARYKKRVKNYARESGRSNGAYG